MIWVSVAVVVAVAGAGCPVVAEKVAWALAEPLDDFFFFFLAVWAAVSDTTSRVYGFKNRARSASA